MDQCVCIDICRESMGQSHVNVNLNHLKTHTYVSLVQHFILASNFLLLDLHFWLSIRDICKTF